MKTKLLRLILIAAIGIVTITISVNVAMAASLTGGATNASNNLYGKAGQYGVKFTTATPGTIGYITVQFPSGTLIPQANVININCIGGGTTGISGSGGSTPKVTYTVTSPVTVPSGTVISLLIIKVSNAPTPGSTSLSVTTNDTSGIAIDGPTSITFGLGSISQGPFTLDNINNRVGINNTSPAYTLDVGGNIGLSGSIIGESTNTLKMTPANGQGICIGYGC